MQLSSQRALWSSALLIGFVSACVGEAPAAHEGSRVSALRPTERTYPFAENGVLVCSARDGLPTIGGAPTYKTEWYPVANMNRHLENIGTPDAVAHVTDAFRTALHSEGITRIESCDDARAYVRLNRELTEWSAGLAPEEVAPGPFVEDAGDALAPKILNATSFDHPASVALWIDPVGSSDLCTGQLISSTALLTAAHCMPFWADPQAFIEIHAWIATNANNIQCISPGASNCADSSSGTGTANVYVGLHPNYDGTPPFDQAVVITNPPWKAPANTSARWTAFPYNMGAVTFAKFTGSTFRLAGYGASTTSAATAVVGFSRRGNASQRIFDAGGNTFRVNRTTASTPIACEGDSGGGAHTSVSTGSSFVPFTFGVFSVFGFSQDGLCGAVGMPIVYSVPDGEWVKSLVNFFSGSSVCNKVDLPQYSFVRCF